MSTIDQVTPAAADVGIAHEALPHIKEYLARHPMDEIMRLFVAGTDAPEVLEVPRGAVELLARILAHMAAGEGVSLLPAHAELTTQQAADLLNVSRPFLIGLLEAGKIEFRTVGRHRRVQADSLREYLRQDDLRRRKAADELSALTQEMGLA